MQSESDSICQRLASLALAESREQRGVAGKQAGFPRPAQTRSQLFSALYLLPCSWR